MLKKEILSIFLFLGLMQTAFAAITRPDVAAATSTPSPAQTAGPQAAGIEAPQGPTRPNISVSAKSHPVASPASASYYLGPGIALINVQGYTGFTPKFFVGYGALVGKTKSFYIGSEIFVGGGSLLLSHNQRYRVNGFAGLSFLPGYKLYDTTILFLRIGPEATYYTNLNLVKIGAMVGIGFQSNVAPHWDMRAEYDYNTNKNLNQYNLDFIYKFC